MGKVDRGIRMLIPKRESVSAVHLEGVAMFCLFRFLSTGRKCKAVEVGEGKYR